LLRIDIDALDTDGFLDRLIHVVESEGVELDDAACFSMQEIINTCYPDMRRAINLLQSWVRDGKLRQSHGIKPAAGIWESYLRDLITTRAHPIREICKIREVLSTLSPDEIEDVYRFLYENGTEFFGDKQIDAIFMINDGQKSHHSALLPEMILLEVIVNILALIK
jgi:DNA polymerase III delta prime subunit